MCERERERDRGRDLLGSQLQLIGAIVHGQQYDPKLRGSVKNVKNKNGMMRFPSFCLALKLQAESTLDFCDENFVTGMN